MRGGLMLTDRAKILCAARTRSSSTSVHCTVVVHFSLYCSSPGAPPRTAPRPAPRPDRRSAVGRSPRAVTSQSGQYAGLTGTGPPPQHSSPLNENATLHRKWPQLNTTTAHHAQAHPAGCAAISQTSATRASQSLNTKHHPITKLRHRDYNRIPT